jgi:hypothetical protein
MSEIRGRNPTLIMVDALYPNFEQPDDRPLPDPKLALYQRALAALSAKDKRWRSNCNRYAKWDEPHRLKWIGHIEREAVKVPPLPMAQTVYIMAMTLRMKG